MASAVIHFQIDEELKEKATESLAALGLTLPEAVALFLSRVADDKVLPFPERVPNKQTLDAMDAEDRGEVFRVSNVNEMMAILNADD